MNFYLIHRVLPIGLLLYVLVFFVVIVTNPEWLKSLEALPRNLSARRGDYILMPLEFIIRKVKKDFRFTPLIVAMMIAIVSALGAALLFFLR